MSEGSQWGREALGNLENHVLLGLSCLLRGLLGGGGAGTRQSNLSSWHQDRLSSLMEKEADGVERRT